MESLSIRETGVVWRARAEKCFSPVIGVAFVFFFFFEILGLCCLAWERRGRVTCFLFALPTLSEPEFDASLRNGVFRQELSDGCGQWSGVKASVLWDVGSLFGVVASVCITGAWWPGAVL